MHIDSVLTLPGSELPFIKQWKQVAAEQQSAVVVMPLKQTDEERYKGMARTFANAGRPVKLLRARR